MIVIATTFRSFGIGDNDLNQKLFIKSLSELSTPIHLVVTQFGEIGVEKELKSINYTLVESTPPWSLSEVFKNAYEKFPNSDIVWTNSDLIFDSNLMNKVLEVLKRFDYATSWPYIDAKNSLDSPLCQVKSFFGLDFLAISKRITNRVSKFVMLYPNKSWGLFEHQIVSYAYLASNKHRGFNLYKSSRVVKLLTPHEQIGEPSYKLRKSWRENLQRWVWVEEGKLRRLWLDFSWVMLKFRGTPVKFVCILIYLSFTKVLKKYQSKLS